MPIKNLEQHQQNLPENLQTDAKTFVSLLTILLQDFQILSAEIRRNYNLRLVTNIKQILTALVSNLEGFNRYFPCPSFEHIHMELNTFVNDWCSVTQLNDENATYILLVKAQTTQLQLDIVQCLVEQPWSSKV